MYHSEFFAYRSSPSMTKSKGAAGQWKRFNLDTPSPTSEGSVTSVDNDCTKPVAELNLNELHSCPVAVNPCHGSTVLRSPQGSSEQELESTNSSHGDVELRKKQRLNGPSGSKWITTRRRELLKRDHFVEETDAKVENENIEAVMLVQAAAALLMLSSDEMSCQSSSSSVCRRSFSSDRLVDGEENLALEGDEMSSEEHATAGSAVLSRPYNKRRYRLVLDLLAETPRVCDEL